MSPGKFLTEIYRESPQAVHFSLIAQANAIGETVPVLPQRLAVNAPEFVGIIGTKAF